MKQETFIKFSDCLNEYEKEFVKLERDLDNNSQKLILKAQYDKLRKLHSKINAEIQSEKNLTTRLKEIKRLEELVSSSCKIDGYIFEERVKRLIFYKPSYILDFENNFFTSLLEIYYKCPKDRDEAENQILLLLTRLDNLKIPYAEKYSKYAYFLKELEQYKHQETGIFYSIISSMLELDTRNHSLTSMMYKSDKTYNHILIFNQDLYQKLLGNLDKIHKACLNNNSALPFSAMVELLGRIIVNAATPSKNNTKLAITSGNNITIVANKQKPTTLANSDLAEHNLKLSNILKIFWQIFEINYRTMCGNEVITELAELHARLKDNPENYNILFLDEYGLNLDDKGEEKYDPVTKARTQLAIVTTCLPLFAQDVETIYKNRVDKSLTSDEQFLITSLIGVCNIRSTTNKEMAAQLFIIACLIKLQQLVCYFEYKNNLPETKLSSPLAIEPAKSKTKKKTHKHSTSISQPALPKNSNAQNAEPPRIIEIDEYTEFAKSVAETSPVYPQRITDLDSLANSIYLKDAPYYKQIVISLEKIHSYLFISKHSQEQNSKLEFMIQAARERELCAYAINTGFIQIPQERLHTLTQTYNFLNEELNEAEFKLISEANSNFIKAALERTYKMLNTPDWHNKKRRNTPSEAAIRYRDLRDFQANLNNLLTPNILPLDPKYIEQVSIHVLSNTTIEPAEKNAFSVSSDYNLLITDKTGVLHSLGPISQIFPTYICYAPVSTAVINILRQ